MNKRTLLAGFIVLAIGIAIDLLTYHFGVNSTGSLWQALNLLSILNVLVLLAGVVLIIYGGLIERDPPVHWDNNL